MGFKDALFQGLAPDGGLYMPEIIPHLGTDFFQSDLSYPELAVGMIHPFTKDDLTHAQLSNICESAFDFPLPIKELNESDSVLELFHGPTLAFKDFAARFMARTMSHFLENENNEIQGLINGKNKLSFSFDMIDENGKTESVFYGEPMPPDFLLSEQIVIIGSYNEERFIANEILLKCPSKYTENNIKL